MGSPRKSDPIACIVMCAGRGTRMGSAETPKVCFPIAGVPAIVRAIRTYRACGVQTLVLVVGAGAGQVIEAAGREFPDLLYAFQAEPRGTGDAARVGFVPLERMGFSGPILIAAGDKLVEPEAVNTLKAGFFKANADCAFLVSRKSREGDLGRVAIDAKGRVRGIFEVADIKLARLYRALRQLARRGSDIAAEKVRALCLATISNPQKLAARAPEVWKLAEGNGTVMADALDAAIAPDADRIDVGGEMMTPDALEPLCKACNESFYMFDPAALAEGFQHLSRRPGRSEEYLTDVVNILANPARYKLARGPIVRAVWVESPLQIQGFNTPDQLMAIEHYMQKKRAKPMPKAAPSIPLGRRVFRPASEWLRLFDEMPPRFRAELRRIYGADEALLRERATAYRRVLRRFAQIHGGQERAIVARAPGSVNLMGRHVDNRGGHVNLMNIGLEVILVAAPRNDDVFRLSNLNRSVFPDTQFSLKQEVSQLDWDDWLSYVQSSRVRRMVLDSKGDWGNYVKAAVLRLQQSFRHVPLRGMDCVVHGNIPPAAGLGASAAILVAASDACIALNGLSVSPQAFIDLCGQGEWYISGSDQTTSRAGMRVGGPGQIATVRHLPFEVVRHVEFPEECRLAICHCAIPADRARQAAGLKRQQIAAFDLALLLLKDRFPQHAHLLDHLRDLNPRRLGVTLRDLYSMLLALPESASPDALRKMLSTAHRERLEEVFSGHEAPSSYDLRSAALFCAAECARSEMFADLVEARRMRDIGILMARSHDAERVASRDDGEVRPYTWRADDAYINALIADLGSEDPGRVLRAQLFLQPGRYGCGAPEIDEMVDLCRRVPGVIGAQLSGVGVAGCVMALLRADAVPALKRALHRGFHARHRSCPQITICTPIAGAGVLGSS